MLKLLVGAVIVYSLWHAMPSSRLPVLLGLLLLFVVLQSAAGELLQTLVKQLFPYDVPKEEDEELGVEQVWAGPVRRPLRVRRPPRGPHRRPSPHVAFEPELLLAGVEDSEEEEGPDQS